MLGISPVSGEFPAQRPVTRSFDVFFDLYLNKRLSKQSWGWWFETPSRPLWRHFNGKTCLSYVQYMKSETHLKPKSREILFVRNIHSPIVLKFCTEHCRAVCKISLWLDNWVIIFEQTCFDEIWSDIRHTGETLLITHHLQLEHIPPFGPIPVGVLCMGDPSSTAVALPGGWWCACESCHVRSVSIRSQLFQIHAEAVSAVSWSFLMVACLMRGATPIALKNFTVDCPTKQRQPTSLRISLAYMSHGVSRLAMTNIS